MSKAREEATEAVEGGAAVFTPRFTASPTEWGDLIEATESVGWELIDWAVSMEVAYPVFRRR
ncbi:hypothetical protein RIF23_10935 [Lipingzhangella sp. LS1_29]|uniref:Uncharacterized protein n=1 Tax=Lipingzhangella rawalii TaxID=2055835 RepID=A0ABU2H7N0_9ACTN|nr:hypothetical protein [Lipingzhangella rawalii]MDS1270815.1 hypothetical protein [Lipingzhangella rawalii]